MSKLKSLDALNFDRLSELDEKLKNNGLSSSDIIDPSRRAFVIKTLRMSPTAAMLGQVGFVSAVFNWLSPSKAVAGFGSFFNGWNKKGAAIWVTGQDTFGQCGVGNASNKTIPTIHPGTVSWVQVAAGGYHSFGLRNDKSLWAFGFNSSGQLGDGTTTQRNTPVPIGSAKWRSITSGYYCSGGIQEDGTLWTWGKNTRGQLGLGDTSQRNTPTQVGTLTWKKLDMDGGDIGPNLETSAAIRSDGTLWTWGENGLGQLGQGDTIDRSSPVQVGAANDWTDVVVAAYSVLALKSDHTLWTWGFNSNGQLGLGDTTNRSSPNQVPGSWAQISGGTDHALGLKVNGDLMAWGGNLFGQLGTSNYTYFSSPVQIPGAWRQISCGYSFSAGIRMDRTLWAWGNNGSGQLGQPSAGSYINSPVQVSGGGAWETVSCGDNHCVLKKVP